MSSDRISTQRVGMAHRRALWVLATCTVAVGAFALAWVLRPTGDSRRGGSDGSPPGAEVCASLTAKLASADARVAELEEGDNTRCLKRMSRLDSCLAKQLACEKAVKEGAARLTETETARAGAINEKNRAAARANESLSEANESSERIAKLTAENSKSRTAYDQLKRLFDKLCVECGAKCAKSCSR
jgi:hypothetical protein